MSHPLHPKDGCPTEQWVEEDAYLTTYVYSRIAEEIQY